MTADLYAAESAIRDRLWHEPGDRFARLQLADLLDDEGREQEAAVQRELAEVKCYRDLSETNTSDILDAWFVYIEGEEREGAQVVEGYDDDLCVHTFQVRTDSGDDECYIISAKFGDLLLGDYRRRAGF